MLFQVKEQISLPNVYLRENCFGWAFVKMIKLKQHWQLKPNDLGLCSRLDVLEIFSQNEKYIYIYYTYELFASQLNVLQLAKVDWKWFKKLKKHLI